MNEDYANGFDYTMIEEQTCVARWMVTIVGKTNRWERDLCGRPAVTVVGGATLCKDHLDWTLEWHRQQTQDDIKREAAEKERAEAFSKWQLRDTLDKSWAPSGPSVVYYLRRQSDGLIKIGTSAHLQSRLSALRREHGPADLLATHCGDRSRETSVHDQFPELHAGGEWFRPGESLIEWITEIRERQARRKNFPRGTVSFDTVVALLGQAAADPAA